MYDEGSTLTAVSKPETEFWFVHVIREIDRITATVKPLQEANLCDLGVTVIF